MSWVQDAELEELLSEPGLSEAVRLLRESVPLVPEPDPVFRAALRRRLVEEAVLLDRVPPKPFYRRLWTRRNPVRSPEPWWRRLPAGLSRPALPRFAPGLAGMTPTLAWPSPPRMAAVGAGVGVAVVALALVPWALSSRAPAVQYQSPLDHAQAVALVAPIELHFNQPMNHQAVERAVRISPGTRAAYEWHGDTLDIRPVNGLAPNTRYRVTVGHGATTASRRPLSASPVISFETWAGGGSGSSSSAVIGDEHQLLAGAQRSIWSTDGRTLYVIGSAGQLVAVPASGGPGQVLESGDVTQVAAGPDGPAYARGGDVHYDQVVLKDVNPVAIGFRDGELVVVSGQSVIDAAGKEIAELDDAPRGANFAASGDRLAYVGTSGLHVVDLRSQRDSLIGPVDRLGSWSADGHRFAYFHDGGLFVTDGARTSHLASTPGAVDVSWSPHGTLLVGGPSSLQVLRGDGTPLESIKGSFGQPQWEPGGSSITFKRDGRLYVGAAPEPQPSAVPSAAPSPEPTAAPTATPSSSSGGQSQPTSDRQTPPSPSSPVPSSPRAGSSSSVSPTPGNQPSSPSPGGCAVRGQRAGARPACGRTGPSTGSSPVPVTSQAPTSSTPASRGGSFRT